MEQENKHKLLKPLLTILIGIILIAGTGLGIWYWQNGEANKQKTDSDKQISELQKQVNDLQKKSTTTTSTAKPVTPTNDVWLKKAKELKFKYIALGSNVRSVIQDPSDSNIFYYADWGSSIDQGSQGPNAIYRFDVSTIKDFAGDDNASLSLAAGELIYQRDALTLKQKNDLLKLVGFDGRNLVFYEDGAMDSPGPCFVPWLNTKNLESINVDGKNPTPQKYNISSAIYSTEKPKQAACIKQLPQ